MIHGVLDGTPVKLPDKYHDYPQNVKDSINAWIHCLQSNYGDRLISATVDRVMKQDSDKPRPVGVFSVAPAKFPPVVGKVLPPDAESRDVMAEAMRVDADDPIDSWSHKVWHHRADVALTALTAAGYAVIKLPTVAFKGPHDTDAKLFRQVADRLEQGRSAAADVGGSNVRRTVSKLLRAAATEAEK